MAGILFPVLLHLWNNKQGRVLPIGSIALLEKAAPRQSRSRRLSEWLLLLLRCLLLILAALLLAGPRWRRPVSAGEKGWIFIGSGVDTVSKPAAYAGLIDSLMKAGYKRQVWRDSTASYREQFAAADRQAKAGLPFYIFTDGMIAHFQGSRPFTGRDIHWYTYKPERQDSTDQWIGKAWLSEPDSIRVLSGSTRSTGTVYQTIALPVREQAEGGMRVFSRGGVWSVQLDSQEAVKVDTTALRIQIYADKQTIPDSRYLEAAFRALQQFSKLKIQIVVTGSELARQAAAMRPDWICWLSSQPIPAGLSAANWLRYQPGKEIAVHSRIMGLGTDGSIALHKYITPPDTAEDLQRIIWKDGFGRPLLEEEHGVLHFYSHFDPAWNGLVWNPSFPMLLQELLFAREEPAIRHDRRVLDITQIQPLHREEPALSFRSATPEEGQVDLASVCWLLIVLLFLTERLVVFAHPKRTVYG